MKNQRMAGCLLVLSTLAAEATPSAVPHPILFVTQVPTGYDFVNMTVSAPFANHLPTTLAAPRGGDLVLLSTTGSLRFLTQEAGYGTPGNGGLLVGNQAIAVRNPAVSFDASKAIFSMVVGAPGVVGGAEDYAWQLYEVVNLQQVVAGQPPQIVKVPNQPAFNNIEPNYLSDGSIVFVSDSPRNGVAALYPVLDEYRGQPANSGLWRLDPASGATLLENTPSGSFGPFVDSFGRLVFSRWDHLNQDLNNDPATSPPTGITPFDYASELSSVTTGTAAVDLFPEPIHSVSGSNLKGFEINQFFPWTVNQDGTEEETLNHLGRHELKSSFARNFVNDANLVDFNDMGSGRANQNAINNLFEIREDPTTPGRYVGIDGVEFSMHHAGQIVAVNAASGTPPALSNANDISVSYVTNRQTATPYFTGSMYPYNIGHFRDPLPMSDGSLVASFANTPGVENASGPLPLPPSNYRFRLYQMTQVLQNGAMEFVPSASALIPPGISKSNIQYNYTSNVAGQANGTVTFSGPLWELQPVEVVQRPTPPTTSATSIAGTPEQVVFDDYNALHPSAPITVADIQRFLRDQDLALVVVRNATSRDRADKQQPYNLRVPGGVGTISDLPAYAGPPLYCIDRMQFLQADQVRGFTTSSIANALPGRRPLPRLLNDLRAVQFNMPGDIAAPGSQFLETDGSTAVFVPARRPIVWQSLAPSSSACGSSPQPLGATVVRERYWIQFQPGEIRVCSSCHGVNQTNQAGQMTPQNPPLALRNLLDWWRGHGDEIFPDDFDT